MSVFEAAHVAVNIDTQDLPFGLNFEAAHVAVNSRALRDNRRVAFEAAHVAVNRTCKSKSSRLRARLQFFAAKPCFHRRREKLALNSSDAPGEAA